MTLNVPPVARFPAVTVPVNTGASAIWMLTVLPLTDVFKLLPVYEPVVEPVPVIFRVEPSLFAEVPVLPAKVMAFVISLFKLFKAAGTVLTAA